MFSYSTGRYSKKNNSDFFKCKVGYDGFRLKGCTIGSILKHEIPIEAY